MKILFLFMLVSHGLIHFMGFAKSFGYAELPELTQAIQRPLGLLWLLAALLFFITGFYWQKGVTHWWMWATPALLLSQSVIILNWPDTRWGTLANLAIAGVALVAWAQWSFWGMLQQEIKSHIPAKLPLSRLVQNTDLEHLPPIVERWLKRSGIVGKPWIHTVQLNQKGQMRTTPGGKWRTVTAKQYFTADHPGFIWFAKVKLLPGLFLLGRDKYQDNQGHVLIKALGLLTVVNSQGAEIDQGLLLRYLGEMVWFPTTALAPWVHWDELNATSSKATLTWGGTKVEGVFYFSPEGDFKRLEAQRYFERETGATLENWCIDVPPQSYQEFQGIRLPTHVDVTWRLKEGDFNGFKLDIAQVKYNSVEYPA